MLGKEPYKILADIVSFNPYINPWFYYCYNLNQFD